MAARTHYARSSALLTQLQRAMGFRKEKFPGLHAISSSVLHRICSREEALAQRHDVMRYDTIPPNLEFIFKMGQAVHDAAQNYMLGPANILTGVWKCRGCLETAGWYPDNPVRMPDVCSKCRVLRTAERGYNFTYEEDELVDPRTGFVSHPDGYDRDGLLFEFKSISTLSFTGSPKSDHVTQVQANLLVQRRCRNNQIPEARLVYVDKSATTLETALTEFRVPFDPKMAETDFKKATELARFRINGRLPSRMCDSPNATRAQGCPLRTHCFSEE